jgi:hypothetical protein
MVIETIHGPRETLVHRSAHVRLKIPVTIESAVGGV